MAITITQALLVSLLLLVFTVGEAWFAYPMINQPLVLCPIVGLIMGDLQTGITAGATLQMIFLGTMQIGGTVPQDAPLGSVIGTAFAISMGQSVEVALTFAVPISMLGSLLIVLAYVIRGLFNPMVEKMVNEGNGKGLERLYYGLAVIPEIPRALVVFFTLIAGSGFAKVIIDTIPQTIIDGLNYATDLMPAVGIALLLRMMWSKQYGVYYFVGLILVSFFKLDVIGVACAGVALAVILFLENRNKQNNFTAAQGSTVAAGELSAEEELFND
ncbi:mannose/fructose/N-acetylgalactosamine-specific phosphotransferase system component IIC [Enterococcus sp. PF1-24]|uniref:PTS mannose/fructose/sorbose/N-acetylgalactosamine transporter subunit IIC n=1 Tax=unclassified Enterococcus TaxID=2608891 RepID=UPI002477053B|nr:MULTISPECIES: PTS sugar transporter subunit IIC [unclassified Enterococcus]MDH6365412.1 mannose/fructose/N-acetylgalactosamine-specific phosphotransferase system component IIC [Enterococcus sp. PFB1-1]MDH6402516.1 mannose/fructose/N-acetylgalactosamine-specific phosphotransferase system component IIC [Enterococcus sp. PF1-24]